MSEGKYGRPRTEAWAAGDTAYWVSGNVADWPPAVTAFLVKGRAYRVLRTVPLKTDSSIPCLCLSGAPLMDGRAVQLDSRGFSHQPDSADVVPFSPKESDQ